MKALRAVFHSILVGTIWCSNATAGTSSEDSGDARTFATTSGNYHHTYSTDFPTEENPISEGGAWISGRGAGLDWGDVRTSPGLAFGAGLPSKFADPTAVLTGEWGTDQQAVATVKIKRPLTSCCHEVELRLRTRITPNSLTGYEINCSIVPAFPYVQIARWNGPLNDFSIVGETKVSCTNGDVLMAKIKGSIITVYKNAEQIIRVEDSTYVSGSPGIGFYESTELTAWDRIRSRFGFASWSDFGLSHFSATDRVDQK